MMSNAKAEALSNMLRLDIALNMLNNCPPHNQEFSMTLTKTKDLLRQLTDQQKEEVDRLFKETK